MKGDTTLDIILSVNDGSCSVRAGKEAVFKAIVYTFVLRCAKGALTIVMTVIAYLNGLMIYMFGLEGDMCEDEVPENENHEIELEDLFDENHNLQFTRV
uniref:Uncharacterized protein n=1 Tax=Caenorhabditis japonica TaxID=281687 RepID=A0A8R1I6K3_CAEJA